MFTRIFSALSVIVFAAGLAACGVTHRVPRFGTGGAYQEGKDEFLKGRAGNMDVAIQALERVVVKDPTYKDSLTLLGRAYYAKGRYQDAFAILQRAVAVNKDDEVAWLTLALTQLRLGENGKGLETLKGGITLMSKVSVPGYKDYPAWDQRGTVRAAIRQTAFLATKENEKLDALIQAGETLLTRLDAEERYQKIITMQQRREEYQP